MTFLLTVPGSFAPFLEMPQSLLQVPTRVVDALLGLHPLGKRVKVAASKKLHRNSQGFLEAFAKGLDIKAILS